MPAETHQVSDPVDAAALLEILDPQRFTRGVKVTPQDLEPIMVRRLKRDLRDLTLGRFGSRGTRRVRRGLTGRDFAWSWLRHLARDLRGPRAARLRDLFARITLRAEHQRDRDR